MIATEIFTSFWKQKKVIALFVAIALLVCHACILIGQTHTATVYIKFLEQNALEGTATNGTKLNPYEITDSYIVSKALNQLGMKEKNVNAIAQRINVTPMISSAEQEKYASWINEFSDYEKTEDKKSTPIYYKIEFESKEGYQFAQTFLSALIEQYRNYYTERYSGYCEVALVPESVALNSDYFYSVELLQKQVEETMSYLSNNASKGVDYRSPKTGYSLSDLADAYYSLLEMKIAPITQYILDTGVSKDASTLVAGLQQSAAAAQRESDENATKADTQKQMMLLYAEKNKEYVSSVISPEDYNNQIYGDMERDRTYLRNLTTYDQFMNDYVDYAVKSGDLLIDKAYINKNLLRFGNSTSSGISPTEEIAEIYEQYALLMNITDQTLDDYNAYRSGRVILQVCSIQTEETLPELLYYTVSGIFALCLACGFIVINELKKSRTKYGAEE